MKIIEHLVEEERILELEDEGILIKDAQDLIDIVASYSVRKIIVRKESITPEFYDLKTKVAGEILQKASNYRIRIGIIGDFKDIKSKSLRDFIYESNKTGQIVFKEKVEDIIDILRKEIY